MGSRWELVGEMGVDSGLCWIGDPCYVLHTPLPAEFGKNWVGFIEGLTNDQLGLDPKEFDHGVCVPTGYGDGSYPVYALRGREGRVMAALVVFDDQTPGLPLEVMDREEEAAVWEGPDKDAYSYYDEYPTGVND